MPEIRIEYIETGDANISFRRKIPIKQLGIQKVVVVKGVAGVNRTAPKNMGDA